MPKASVKIMRSYDYCHFEVALGSDEDLDLDGINDLRKQAAVLVDEAVRQYKIAKRKESEREATESSMRWQLESLERARKTAPGELTPEQAALLRNAEDKDFWKDYEEDDYYYGDPERDHHFSMLRKFQEARVKG